MPIDILTSLLNEYADSALQYQQALARRGDLAYGRSTDPVVIDHAFTEGIGAVFGAGLAAEVRAAVAPLEAELQLTLDRLAMLQTDIDVWEDFGSFVALKMQDYSDRIGESRANESYMRSEIGDLIKKPHLTKAEILEQLGTIRDTQFHTIR